MTIVWTCDTSAAGMELVKSLMRLRIPTRTRRALIYGSSRLRHLEIIQEAVEFRQHFHCNPIFSTLLCAAIQDLAKWRIEFSTTYPDLLNSFVVMAYFICLAKKQVLTSSSPHMTSIDILWPQFCEKCEKYLAPFGREFGFVNYVSGRSGSTVANSKLLTWRTTWSPVRSYMMLHVATQGNGWPRRWNENVEGANRNSWMNMTSYYAQTPRFAHEQDIVENDEFQWAPHKTDEIVLKKWALHFGLARKLYRH